MLELRPYQAKGVTDLRDSYGRGFTSPLYVLPTGGGKTVLFSFICASANKRGKRAMVLVHRDELLDQVSKTLSEFDVEHGFVRAGEHYDRDYRTHVASVFTLAKRLDAIEVPDIVITDEAHHAILGSTWGYVLAEMRKRNPKLQVLGVTATPERLGGEGLGDMFDTMVLGPTTAELIAMGALARYRMFAPAQAVDLSGLHSRAGDFVRGEVTELMEKPAIIGNVISHYRKLLQGRPSIAFCASIEHAELMATRFKAEGYRAISIDGRMEKTVRRGIVEDFRRGAFNVLTSCDLVSEGFDLPGLHGAILLRPTQSLALYLQQVGRALRPAEGKEFAYILDHVGNSQRHGMPDDDREWTLLGRAKKKAGDREVGAKQCPSCFAMSASTARKCSDCGKDFPVESRTVEEREGELQEIERERAERMQKIEKSRTAFEQASAKSLATLIDLGRRRKLKNPEGWAKHVWDAREKKRMESLTQREVVDAEESQGPVDQAREQQSP